MWDADTSKSAEQRDFRFVGIIWVVQVRQGWRSEFYRLADVQRYLAEGRIQKSDLLSYDRENWTRIDRIQDLEAHFDEVWHKAASGQLKVRHEIGRSREFDESEPTRIQSLAQIHRMLEESQPKIDPLRLTPPDIEPMEMPENTGMFEAIEEPADGRMPEGLDALEDMDDGNTGMFDVEDEPTMEPPAPLRTVSAQQPPALIVPPAQQPVRAPDRAPLLAFLAGILAALAVVSALAAFAG